MRILPTSNMIAGIVLATLVVSCAPAAPAPKPAPAARAPIIDMHLHARRADYAGPNPPPMCSPFSVMPRSDATDPQAFAFAVDPPCASPISP